MSKSHSQLSPLCSRARVRARVRAHRRVSGSGSAPAQPALAPRPPGPALPPPAPPLPGSDSALHTGPRPTAPPRRYFSTRQDGRCRAACSDNSRARPGRSSRPPPAPRTRSSGWRAVRPEGAAHARPGMPGLVPSRAGVAMAAAWAWSGGRGRRGRALVSRCPGPQPRARVLGGRLVAEPEPERVALSLPRARVSLSRCARTPSGAGRVTGVLASGTGGRGGNRGEGTGTGRSQDSTCISWGRRSRVPRATLGPGIIAGVCWVLTLVCRALSPGGGQSGLAILVLPGLQCHH